MLLVESQIHSVGVPSTSSPLKVVNEKVSYPNKVVNALFAIYIESNKSYLPLVQQNREWQRDYQFAHKNGFPLNFMVQIDMVGLTQENFQEIELLNEQEAVEYLKQMIFELEPSWAFYGGLAKMFDVFNGGPSYYALKADELLSKIREKTKKKIVLLAVTQKKYDAMLGVEFGLSDRKPTPEEVKLISGFDEFWGPSDFLGYFKRNSDLENVSSEYLFNVRPSDPIEKLKNPKLEVDHPLLSDSKIREFLKRYTLTLNIDNPEWEIGSKKKINDTKYYLPSMGMGYLLETSHDVKKLAEFSEYMSKNNAKKTIFRAKPAQGTFGCYGHISGSFLDKQFINQLEKAILLRGAYIIQPEREAPLLKIQGEEYFFLDRVFVGWDFMENKPMWLAGHREMLPKLSDEGKSRRLHMNHVTVTAEIV